jgi:drug/metabolite transporter (DMT)-like permease
VALIPNPAIAALIGAVVVWATTFVISADVLMTNSPAVLTVLRFAIAAVLLVPLAMWRRAPVRDVLASPVGAFLGLSGVTAYYGLQNVGLQYTSAGTTALLQAVLPVATALLAAVVLRERVEPRVAVGLVMASVGVVLVASSAPRFDLGTVLIVIGLVAYALYTVALRWSADHLQVASDWLAVATASCIWGVGFLLPWLAWEVASGRSRWPDDVGTLGELIYLGVVASGVTLLLWSYGAARTSATIAGVITAGVPALGYAIAVLFGEPAVWTKTAGGVLAVVGIVVATLASRGRRPTLDH